MSVAAAYKVRIKLGQAEFDAEGPEETVKKSLAEFLELAPNYADRATKRQGLDLTDFFGSSSSANNDERVGAADAAAPEIPSSYLETSVNPQVLNRLFKEDSNGLISLRVLPSQSEEKAADTLFLILFGYLIRKGQSDVTATDLLASAKQSGISLRRIDQTMDKPRFRSLITRGGSRNGSRYALTNPGIMYAEEVASRIFS